MLAGLQPGNCPPMHLPLVAGTVESVAGRNSLPAIEGFLLKASLIATCVGSVHTFSEQNLFCKVTEYQIFTALVCSFELIINFKFVNAIIKHLIAILTKKIKLVLIF